ncbi:MAG: glutamate--tRNA ligase [Candidatus Levybacteria bacterium]|nr:glutamate--tRNA ligase [Candidatus Levybacteria bacterium]
MVRVRIAPSPTGIPHIGNTRTALFNFLFAKHNKGKFVLRIEDTDQKRIVKGAKEAIVEILEWLGMDVDEMHIQSERLDEYKKYAKVLVESDLAFEEEGAIWMKMPKGKIFSWQDKIGNKKISFKSDVLEDFVILKSDGFPTYHLANVVDDHLMNISHIIRGDEWISSTPKHILLYESFGWKLPLFAHLPVILGPDKTKLSKRHGAKSVLDYRSEGYLKEALINFMALLGWGPSANKELMDISEMISLFDLSDVNSASPIFDIKKLDWMNGEYIRRTQNSKLKTQIWEYLGKKYPIQIIEKTIPLARDRIKKLSDYLPLCEFFFKEPNKYEIDLSQKKDMLRHVLNTLKGLRNWKGVVLGEKMQKLASSLKIRNSEFFMMLRVAITGKKISPPLNESMEILGKEKVLERIKNAMPL